ncbi:hypothetical protein PVL29_021448 [Vitis rotundifolia]|uniref:Polygalacturonase n=1 Tax=Vitis rotundifolia TaxID=103349 RepID=A0AA38YZV1_VITRO|nr:hypothetical protein PVL29_021448 [Vitis rotundifolia]
MGFCLNPRKSLVLEMVSDILEVGLLSGRVGECQTARTMASVEYPAINCQNHSAVVKDKFADDGGAHLIVRPGKWQTGSFNLTSHFTLYIHKDAIILSLLILANFSIEIGRLLCLLIFLVICNVTFEWINQQDESDYPIVKALPSYGGTAGRFSSLILGTNLTDVVITCGNGMINGQGKPWWDKFHEKRLNATRPNLIEIVNVIIQGLTIIAPVTVPDTDGINPVSGDDCIAVKSALNENRVQCGMPTEGLIIRRLTCISPHSAVIALGREMSGRIMNVRAEDITAIDSESGDFYVRRMTMKTMRFAFWIIGDYGPPPAPSHEGPVIEGINYRDMVADNVTYPAQLHGISGDPFTGFCTSNQWDCDEVQGVTSRVTPQPCDLQPPSKEILNCPFPKDLLPIEDLFLL